MQWITKMGWHSWFAWYPVHIKPGVWVWLETIERHCERSMYDVWKDYRLPQ